MTGLDLTNLIEILVDAAQDHIPFSVNRKKFYEDLFPTLESYNINLKSLYQQTSDDIFDEAYEEYYEIEKEEDQDLNEVDFDE